ncbi:hypothetical protein F5Y04DRAFT_282039 [Hypomontagnella monticulosa]|nr:hypothetical protein F5Y04DRAFT_282039 [Hypomontagnella monticulosa]
MAESDSPWCREGLTAEESSRRGLVYCTIFRSGKAEPLLGEALVYRAEYDVSCELFSECVDPFVTADYFNWRVDRHIWLKHTDKGEEEFDSKWQQPIQYGTPYHLRYIEESFIYEDWIVEYCDVTRPMPRIGDKKLSRRQRTLIWGTPWTDRTRNLELIGRQDLRGYESSRDAMKSALWRKDDLVERVEVLKKITAKPLSSHLFKETIQEILSKPHPYPAGQKLEGIRRVVLPAHPLWESLLSCRSRFEIAKVELEAWRCGHGAECFLDVGKLIEFLNTVTWDQIEESDASEEFANMEVDD